MNTDKSTANATTKKIRVVLADDHEVVRDGVRQLLEGAGDIEVVGEAKNGDDAVALYLKLEPDVLVLDVQMPESSGLSAATYLLSGDHRPPNVIMFSQFFEQPTATALFQKGIKGYVLKETSKQKLVEAVRKAATGEIFVDQAVMTRMMNAGTVNPGKRLYLEMAAKLTEREQEILALILEHLEGKEMCKKLNVAYSTLRTHKRSILHKLGCRTMNEICHKYGNMERMKQGIEGGSSAGSCASED